MTEWWTATQGTLVGALGGASIGIVLGSLGAVVGVLAARGKLRSWAVTMIVAFTFAGALTLLAGAVALGLGQPYHVYYPLLLLGGIVAIVCGANIVGVRNAVRSCQQRKLAAAELRRS